MGRRDVTINRAARREKLQRRAAIGLVVAALATLVAALMWPRDSEPCLGRCLVNPLDACRARGGIVVSLVVLGNTVTCVEKP